MDEKEEPKNPKLLKEPNPEEEEQQGSKKENSQQE